MEIKSKQIIEINSLENLHPIKGTSIDYVIVKKELKKAFRENSIYGVILPMLNKGGQIIYI